MNLTAKQPFAVSYQNPVPFYRTIFKIPALRRAISFVTPPYNTGHTAACSVFSAASGKIRLSLIF
jgi:hypothetical protein